jgi:hypothetical protein
MKARKAWGVLIALAGGVMHQFCGCLNPCDLSLPSLSPCGWDLPDRCSVPGTILDVLTDWLREDLFG